MIEMPVWAFLGLLLTNGIWTAMNVVFWFMSGRQLERALKTMGAAEDLEHHARELLRQGGAE